MTELERFFAKVEKTPGGCWLWTASIRPNGYGQLLWRGRPGRKAHRVSYEIHRGPIPSGMCVLHTCDVRACVNPDHLWLGTKADNNNDRAAKGRSVRMVGETSGRAVLTDAAVIDMRRRAAAGGNISAMSREYGVNTKTAWNAVHGVTWKHINEPKERAENDNANEQRGETAA